MLDTKDNWRMSIISKAEVYANHKWMPSKFNSYHGQDTDGISVNTPDIDYKSTKYSCNWWIADQVNVGIPYNWGGLSSIIEFEEGLRDGKYAGNVPDYRGNGISSNCVGVDCSGLVTICWGTPDRLSTGSIVGISERLESPDLLLPGDVLLLPGSHVMIFIKFIDINRNTAQIVDATRSTGRVMVRNVNIAELQHKGYDGYRKLGITIT